VLSISFLDVILRKLVSMDKCYEEMSRQHFNSQGELYNKRDPNYA
jgi:hypothetical protein